MTRKAATKAPAKDKAKGESTVTLPWRFRTWFLHRHRICGADPAAGLDPGDRSGQAAPGGDMRSCAPPPPRRCAA